jgi:hypothetical protein
MSESTANSEAIVKYGGLTNAELLLIYFRFKKYLENLDSNLDQQQISKPIDTPMGKGVAFKKVSSEHVERFKKTEYYKLTRLVVEKLEPIAEIIIECDESLKSLADELR